MCTDDIECHPWQPYIPQNARIFILGTFPPAPSRWSMEFYYPNRINDFWRIMGLIFFNDKDALFDTNAKCFKLDEITRLLDNRGIALGDTAAEIRRLKGNASDKYLEILKPIDLRAALSKIPQCSAIATTGEKAAGVIASITDTQIPEKGGMVSGFCPGIDRQLSIFRMPSTSRAYPLPLEKKADYYISMFRKVGILN